MRRSLCPFLASALLFVAAEASSDFAKAAERPLDAVVAATLPTATGQPRQFAFDGNLDTFYVSSGHPSADDHFTLVLDQPVSATLIAAVSGRPDGEDELEAGVLEVSADGTTFESVATFEGGAARADAAGRKIRAIRIRPSAGLSHPLVVRELSLVSDPPVARFRYPVEFVVDVSDAPEMKEWGDKVARLCERSYGMINDELHNVGDRPPHWVPIRLRKDYRGGAMAGGGRITGSVRYFKEHPDDLGAMVHESVHIVQRYPGRSNPSWLVEGVSDYVRFFKFEPGNLGRIDPQRAHYNQSYRVTAAFLAYLTEKYDGGIVPKLNKLMREGKYREDIFKELTGKTPQELDEEWRATLQSKS